MPEFNPTIHGNLRQPSKKGRASLKNYTGQKFNRLLVFGFLGMTDSAAGCRESHWLCRCDCGKWWVTTGARLGNSQSQSCGCWNLEKPSPAKTHGKSNDLVYRIWRGIHTRSFNLKHKSSKRYGQRGITMCAGIRKFEDFHAVMGEPPTPQHSIDRWPDRDGSYWCGDCDECKANGRSKNMRWATPREQGANLKKNVWLTANGETLIMAEWARRLGVHHETIRARLRKGMSDAQALGFEP